MSRNDKRDRRNLSSENAPTLELDPIPCGFDWDCSCPDCTEKNGWFRSATPDSKPGWEIDQTILETGELRELVEALTVTLRHVFQYSSHDAGECETCDTGRSLVEQLAPVAGVAGEGTFEGGGVTCDWRPLSTKKLAQCLTDPQREALWSVFSEELAADPAALEELKGLWLVSPNGELTNEGIAAVNGIFVRGDWAGTSK